MATTLDEWAAWMATQAGQELRALLRRTLVKEAVRIEADAKRNATTKPRVRSGRLRNSIRVSVIDNEDGSPDGPVSLRVRAGGKGALRYAALQEYGGTVRSKRPGGYLAVPLGPAKTAAGVLRQEFARPLRTVPGLVCIRSKSGKLLLAREKGTGKKKTLEPLFVLVRSVTIQPKRYLRNALSKSFDRLTRTLGPELAGAFIPAGDR